LTHATIDPQLHPVPRRFFLVAGLWSDLPEMNRDYDGRIYARPIAGAYAEGGEVKRLLIEPKR
jgi:hypothetical protein